MIVDIESKRQLFLEQFQGALPERNADDPLSRLRFHAWERFMALGLPGVKHEFFQFVRLSPLLRQRFLRAEPWLPKRSAIEVFQLPECTGRFLVLVNGFYVPELSDISAMPKGFIALSLNEAMPAFGAIVQNSLARSIKEEGNPFVQLNGGLMQGGLFCYLPPKLAVEEPLQILNFVGGDAPVWAMPRIQLFLSRFSELHCIGTTAALTGHGHFMNRVLDCTLDEGSQLHLVQQEISPGTECGGTFFEAIRAHQKRASNLKVIHFADGKSLSRADMHVLLAGEDANAHISGLAFATDAAEAHVNAIVEHMAPRARSMQLFKNILLGKALTSFQGKIYVHQAAQKTEAYQLNNNIVLSNEAEAHSKPNLEIFADDVKASHGATVGELGEEELFYLETRGLDRQEARNLLVKAFASDVIQEVKLASLQRKLAEWISM